MVFLKEFFEKVDFEKNQQTAKKNTKNFPGGQRVNPSNAPFSGVYCTEERHEEDVRDEVHEQGHVSEE